MRWGWEMMRMGLREGVGVIVSRCCLRLKQPAFRRCLSQDPDNVAEEKSGFAP